MLELLQVWSSADENSQEEAEMRVRDKFKDNFKVLTITLPAAMESQEKEEVQEIVRRWNSNHATKCVLGQDVSSEEKDGEWNDASFAKENKITGLRVQRGGGDNPCSIQARYGSQWAGGWRGINWWNPESGNEVTLEFGLDGQRTVTAVTGISNNDDGNTWMVKATMSDGEEWTAGSQREPNSGFSLRPSPSSTPLVLSHLSGNITKYARILRFHWRPQ